MNRESATCTSNHAPGRRWPACWHRLFVALLALAAGAPRVMAQPGAPNPYAQPNPYAAPNPYPQQGAPANPYAQPIQPVQYPYGGYSYAPPPSYYYPRPVPPAFGYNNGYGVNYYFVQNPYAYSGPFRPANAPPPPPPVNYPQPYQPLPPLPQAQDDLAGTAPGGEAADGPGCPAPPTISFRRPTSECFWFDSSYMATFMRPMHMNGPLVTTGNPNDPVPGALGQPGTTTLFGGNSIDNGLFSGIHAELGMFVDHDNRFSIDVSGFYIFPDTTNFYAAAAPNGTPVISRPYFNVANGVDQPFRFANSAPGQLAGNIGVDTRSEMADLELNARLHAYVQDRYHFDFLFGMRYMRLQESMQVHEQVNPINGNTVPFQGTAFGAPDYLTDQDYFGTLNQFIGAQIGARLSWEERWFTLSAFSKLGMGATLQHTDINGSTSLVTPAGMQTAGGGVLALPSNSGVFDRTVFGLVPELGLDLAVNITQNVRLTFGYSFLLWNQVVRPGSQYDTNINPGQVNSSFFYGTTTGPTSPTHQFNSEVFWMNSFNVGFEVHF